MMVLAKTGALMMGLFLLCVLTNGAALGAAILVGLLVALWAFGQL